LTEDKSALRLEEGFCSGPIQYFRYHFFESLDAVSPFFHKDRRYYGFRKISTIRLERMKHHGELRDTVIDLLKYGHFPGIR